MKYKTQKSFLKICIVRNDIHSFWVIEKQVLAFLKLLKSFKVQEIQVLSQIRWTDTAGPQNNNL